MKAIATIANKKRPEGWKEEFLFPGIESEKAGTQRVEEILKKFNSDLRGDEPRKLLKVTFCEMTIEECNRHGYTAYPDEDCPFSENRKESMDAWWDGWREADREAEEGEAEDEDEDEEEDEDEDEDDE